MISVFKNLQAGAPISFTAQLNMMQWRDKQKNFVTKYVVTELAFVGTTLASTLEGVGALFASLAVKGLNYVVPERFNFSAKVVKPVLQYRHLTRMAFSYSLAALFYNITTKDPIRSKTRQEVNNFYVKLGKTYDEVYASAFAKKGPTPA